MGHLLVNRIQQVDHQFQYQKLYLAKLQRLLPIRDLDVVLR
uniref:Transposase n=1 Tax=Schistosoma curassoni TaxID=6186 RepID=A0A183K716_9TREM